MGLPPAWRRREWRRGMIAPQDCDAAWAGVDEAGRGPLAGPVIAGAVLLDAHRPIDGLKDSKRLSAKRREQLAATIRRRALAFGLGRAEVAEIDALNILKASLLAMARAVAALPVQPKGVYVDGRHPLRLGLPSVAVVGGDDLLPAISAGAILAKTVRDAEMRQLATVYPGYGFAQHKGYGTKAHLASLQALGPSPAHRRSFAPVRRAMQAQGQSRPMGRHGASQHAILCAQAGSAPT